MRPRAYDRDEAWLVQMADGDRTALDEVLTAYGGEVLAVVSNMLSATHEAEEVVQEVFLLLWRQAPCWPKSRGPSLCLWLLAEARKQALAELMRRPEAITYGRDVALLSDFGGSEDGWRAHLRCQTPIDRARLQARQALARLRPSGRRMLSLALLRGATPAVLGQLTGQPTRKARRLLVGAVRAAREAVWSRQEHLF